MNTKTQFLRLVGAISVLAVLFASLEMQAALSPVNLRSALRTNPQGVEDTAPAFRGSCKVAARRAVKVKARIRFKSALPRARRTSGIVEK